MDFYRDPHEEAFRQEVRRFIGESSRSTSLSAPGANGTTMVMRRDG